jgi:hypothetical protein
VTPAHLAEAEATTTMMPAVTAAVAAAAEDREFWGRIEHLKEDEELAFWDTLHSEITATETGGPAPVTGHVVPAFGGRGGGF